MTCIGGARLNLMVGLGPELKNHRVAAYKTEPSEPTSSHESTLGFAIELKLGIEI